MATKTAQHRNQFEIDVSRIRDNASKHTEDGAEEHADDPPGN